LAAAVQAAAPLPAHDVRKTVTIIFTDLKDSTALGEVLDPEALHEVKERYFGAMAAEITRHGGKIEKYIGDAIMAVFGLPRAHEDDGLRAVRAATGMQEALARVNEDLSKRFGVTLANRTGVNTGEVVANADPGADQKLATGDAVNVAARLEQAAPLNGIYLGEITYRLVRDAVEVEPVEPLELKGKAKRVAAYRLVSSRGLDGNVRRQDTPVVGRDAELAALAAVYREASDERAVRLVTVIGDAGLGKSRLVREVTDRIARDARVLHGRCLPYGDGITFWPLREMVSDAAGSTNADDSESALAKLQAVTGDANVADRLAAAIGLTAAAFPLHELYWAARKFFETLAADGPLVALIDDLHWAEPAFLDLIEHVLDTAEAAPVLLLCTARHDLLDDRPQWGERARSTRLVLGPLSDAASASVVANLLGQAGLPSTVIERIVRAAEGNPLFVEQMLSMLIDSGALRNEDGQWVRAASYGDIAVPPTIHALLEARLDKLDRKERAAVEPASVIGMEFARPAVESLAPEAVRPGMSEHLATLTRKQFIHPAPQADPGSLYRFHHHLVRDTVYNGLLKRARATMHIDFVRWADRVNADRDRALEFEEILGYHLEQAFSCLSDLGPLDAQGLAIGADAGRRLANAGRRAFSRGDMHAAANLYRRSIGLLAKDDSKRLGLLPELAEVLIDLGEFPDARAVLSEAIAESERAGAQRVHAWSGLLGLLIRLFSAEPGDWSEEILRVAGEAIPVLERESAHYELANAWRIISFVHGTAGRFAKVYEASGHSMTFARLAQDDRLAARSGMGVAMSALFGSTPVAEAIAQCERILADGLSDRQAESVVMCTIAQLHAMNGEFEQARLLCRQGRAQLRDLGQGVNAASTSLDLARVELLAGDLAGAEQEVRADYSFLSQMGEKYFLPSIAALLSRLIRDQGRDEEAMEFSKVAEAMAAESDIEPQAMWRLVRAPIVARSGELEAAEALARTAIGLARQTDIPVLQADACAELATVLGMAGRLEEARQSMGEAVALYAAKGDKVSAARSRAQLEQWAPAAAA
jgi:class 3 adenylate cyclase/tetratricopeptide (TPR) repeat protein